MDQPKSRVMRIPRGDVAAEFVLLHISSAGDMELDLRLEATDGQSPFVATIDQRHVSRLREKKHIKSKDEWEKVLRDILVGKTSLAGADAAAIDQHAQCVAQISQTELTLIIRRNVEGFIQRLGAISLRRDDELEIDTIAWALTAAGQCDRLEQSVEHLTRQNNDEVSRTEELRSKLAELEQAKQRDEDLLLDRFVVLLNAKKRKIRNQQRLLASAHVDPNIAAQISKVESAKPDFSSSSSSDSIKHSQMMTRGGKRKAVKDSPSADDSNEDDEAFEHVSDMETRIKKEPATRDHIDRDEVARQSHDSTRETSSDTSAHTADEDESEMEAEARTNLALDLGERAADSIKTKSPRTMEMMQIDVPPPARQMPFAASSTRERTSDARDTGKCMPRSSARRSNTNDRHDRSLEKSLVENNLEDADTEDEDDEL